MKPALSPRSWVEGTIGTSLVVFALLSFFTWAGLASAAQPTPSGASGRLGVDLGKVLEEKARIALERHLKPEEFQVFVKATPIANPPDDVPYFPGSMSPLPSDDSPAENLAPFLKRVDVEVLIVDSYDKAAKRKLEDLLRKRLALDAARGDRVTFKPLGVQSKRSESTVERELTRTEADARDLKNKLESVGRDRDDVKRDLSHAKAELDRMARERDGRPAGGTGEVRGTATERGFWRENAGLLVVALLIVVALGMVALGLRGAAKIVGAAVQSIGTGLPAMAEKFADSLGARSQVSMLQARAGAEPTNSGSKSLPPTSVALPMEAVSKRILELHGELVAMVTPDTEAIVLEYLGFLIADPGTVGRAVATMELLGKDRANALYDRLGLEQKQQVATFLRNGSHDRAKGEVMLEAGEALKTRLFGAAFGSRANLNPQIVSQLLGLKPDDLADATANLSDQGLARFMLYLDPIRTVGMLAALRESGPARVARAMAQLAKIPEVEMAKELDGEVLNAIVDQSHAAKSDALAAYLSHYKALVEGLDDDLAEIATEQLSAASSRLANFLQESVVTFGTFFKLHGDVQEEILAKMPNRDVAAVAVLLRDDLKSLIFELLETRRRDLVDEEITQLTAKGVRQVNATHRNGKRQVVARILELKGQGSINDLLQQKEPQNANAMLPPKSNVSNAA